MFVYAQRLWFCIIIMSLAKSLRLFPYVHFARKILVEAFHPSVPRPIVWTSCYSTRTTNRILFSTAANDEQIHTLSNDRASKQKRNKRRADKKQLFRADRVLSNRTGKPRSECFELLKNKRIFQLASPRDKQEETDGKEEEENLILVPGPSSKLSMDAELRVDRTHAIPLLPPLLMVYHKPKWVLSVRNDPYNRQCVVDIPNMHPVGRLDYDSQGLLLFSSSGALTQHLLHPKHQIQKQYMAVVNNRVDELSLREKLQQGVETTEGIHTAQLAHPVEHFEPERVAAYLNDIRENLPSEYNRTDLRARGYLNVLDASELSTVRLVVAEGKHRMVRRMLANCGHPVVTLKRERLGVIDLIDPDTGEEMEEGSTRTLTEEEMEWAESLIQAKVKPKYVAKTRGSKKHGRRSR